MLNAFHPCLSCGCCNDQIRFYFSMCVWGRISCGCLCFSLKKGESSSPVDWCNFLAVCYQIRFCLWFPSFCNINVNLYYMYWLSGCFFKILSLFHVLCTFILSLKIYQHLINLSTLFYVDFFKCFVQNTRRCCQWICTYCSGLILWYCSICTS